MSLVSELKRRKVVHVAAVYLVVAWVIIQIVDVVNEPLSLPDWFDTVAILIVAIGFPIAVILSWAFDLTPEGVVRDQGTNAAVQSSGGKFGYVLIGLVVIAAGWILYRMEISPSEQAVETVAEETERETLPNSIAVLPFDNLSPNADDAYFAAGLHDEIVSQLAKLRNLSVISRTSVLRYADSDLSIPEIARELNVGTVMEGSVRYANDRVRITTQLIDAATDEHLWSETYDREFADIFAIESDIAMNIANALEAEFSLDEQESIARPPTSSPEAHTLYLRAIVIWGGGDDTATGSLPLRTNIKSYLDRAILVDPTFAMAYVQRARLAAITLNFDVGTQENFASRRAELEGLALADLETALAVNPDLGAAYGTLARIHQYNWRGAEAGVAYERAVELSPNDPGTLIDYAVFSSISAHHEDAVRLGQRALELDPNSGVNYGWLNVVYTYAGDLVAAAAAGRKATALAPTYPTARTHVAITELLLGNNAEALAELRIAEQLFQDNTNLVFHALIAYIYGRIGQRDEAARLFRWIENNSADRRVPPVGWVLAYLAVGDNDLALEWLSRAAESPEPYEGHFTVGFLKANFYSDPILDQREFVEVRSRLGFKE
jgi:TolB-like protein/Tfp pilus assembly protein PilF